MQNTKIEKASIIIPVKNEGSNIRTTVESIVGTPGKLPYEVIVVDDASEDDCCRFLEEDPAFREVHGVRLVRTAGIGAANARNLGAAQADGEILIFSDAHVYVEAGWLDKMAATMAETGIDVLTPGIAAYGTPERLGFGQTWNEKLETKWLPKPAEVSPIPLAPGGLEAIRKEAFAAVGGFETGFKIWGYEDVELSFKCWLFGFGVYTTPEVTVQHIFRTRHPYYISFDQVNYNLMRMAVSHFNRGRIARAIRMIRFMPNTDKILAEIAQSDTWEQRRNYLQQRKYDDDWFMSKFQIPF